MIISIPYTFSSGAVIIAAQHNSNFSTIYNDYNGFIDNTNIATAAGIVYSKLNLTGGILNADVNASAGILASKLVLTSPGAIGTVAPAAIKATTLEATTSLKLGTTNQGDIIYDNGTSLVRLPPGTSGQLLKTQGASANPLWSTNGVISNVLFQYSAAVVETGSGLGEIIGTTLVPTTATGNYRFLAHRSAGNSSYNTVWATKWKKIPSVSTITFYAQIWQSSGASSALANIKVDVGGANGNVSGTINQQTPEWVTNTIDVSGLSDGTVYDVTISLMHAANTTVDDFLGNLISFGS